MRFILERLESIDSTNQELHRRAARGAPDGTVLLAATQTAGRGRHGRKWEAPPGGLWMSVLIRRSGVAGLQLVVAASLCGALSRWGAPLQVRWPNDLVCGGKKLGGVLAEARTQSQGSYCVLGIGVNVDLSLEELPLELRDQSTTLSLVSREPLTLAEVEKVVLGALSADLGRFFEEGLEPFLAELEARSEVKGQEVRLEYADHSVRGRVTDFTPEGGLVLEDGSVHLAPLRLEIL